MNIIHTQLVEISQMFTKFSEMVSMQELMVRRIEEDIERAEENAEQGRKELVTLYDYVSSYRSLLIKIFMILMIFATVYILLVV